MLVHLAKSWTDHNAICGDALGTYSLTLKLVTCSKCKKIIKNSRFCNAKPSKKFKDSVNNEFEEEHE